MKKTNTLSIAKEYLRRGFSVIPLLPKSKKPAIVSWREFQKRLPTEEVLTSWFGNGSRNNIGIVTGAISGLAVLDADSAEAVEWCETNLLQTPIVKTARGRHYYFKYRPGIRNSVNINGLKLDLRGDGGYVVAPPSVHESGIDYEWIEGQGLDDLPLADLPEILLAKTGLYKSPVRTLLTQGTVKGQRNDSLARIAGALFAKGLDYDEAISLCLAWNQRNAPLLPEREIKNTVESIFKTHLMNHGSETEFECTQEKKWTQDVKQPSMAPISLKELFAKPETPVNWLVDGIFPVGGLSGVVGKPKTGKSTLARQQAVAIAGGDDFLGRRTHQGPVIYYALEEKESEVKKHFTDMGAKGDEPIYCYSGGATKDSIKQIGAAIREIRPVLIIVDPLFRLVRVKDGNDYAQMTQAIEPILRMARDTGAHVQFLHHAPKAAREEAGDAVLGSTAIFASVDTLLLIKRHEDYRTVQTVQRYGEDLPETTLIFDKDSRTITLGGGKEEEDLNGAKEAITDYLSKQAEPVTEAVIGSDVEGRTALKRKALRALVSEKRLIRHGKGGRKDPFRYARLGVPDVLSVPDVPENPDSWEHEPQGHTGESSCSDVPGIPINTGNNKQNGLDIDKNAEKSSCSQYPHNGSCSQEDFDLSEGEF